MDLDGWEKAKSLVAALGTGAVVGFVLAGLFDLQEGVTAVYCAWAIGGILHLTGWFGLFRRK